MFGICWAPFHTDRLMWSFIDQKSEHMKIFHVYEYVHVISGVFFYLSSAINPILYNLMSTRFREMFKEVMCHHKWHPAPRKYSLSMTRVTVRSTVSEVPPCNGTNTTEGEDYDMDGCQENKTNFIWETNFNLYILYYMAWCWNERYNFTKSSVIINLNINYT